MPLFGLKTKLGGQSCKYKRKTMRRIPCSLKIVLLLGLLRSVKGHFGCRCNSWNRPWGQHNYRRNVMDTRNPTQSVKYKMNHKYKSKSFMVLFYVTGQSVNSFGSRSSKYVPFEQRPPLTTGKRWRLSRISQAKWQSQSKYKTNENCTHN